MPKPAKSRVILMAVAEWYDVGIKDITGQRRSRTFVNARHTAMFILKHTTELSYPEIGMLLGGKDHTSVMHGDRRVKNLMVRSPQWQADVEEIIQTVRNNGYDE